jgi:hypothetical protein
MGSSPGQAFSGITRAGVVGTAIGSGGRLGIATDEGLAPARAVCYAM